MSQPQIIRELKALETNTRQFEQAGPETKVEDLAAIVRQQTDLIKNVAAQAFMFHPSKVELEKTGNE